MFVSPSDLTENQFKAIRAIGRYGKPVPYCGGMVFAKDMIFRLSLAKSLEELELIRINQETLVLTSVGNGLYKKITSA